MFDDVAEIQRARKEYNLKMFRSGVAVFRELEEAENHALEDGALDRKSKELIALAVGIANGCYG